MEPSVRQHLHSATLRTLHAHSFNRASSTAAHTLTDIFSRYLELIASTAKWHAEHSGRDGAGVNVWDAMAALSELGVGLEELDHFLHGEAKEMKAYGLTKRDLGIMEGEAAAETSAAARRLDSLADIKSAISDGLETDILDVIPLQYRRASSPVSETPSSSPSTPTTSPTVNGIHPVVVNGIDFKGKGKQRELFGDESEPQAEIDRHAMDLSTPKPVAPPLVLPLSPISNPAYSRPSSPPGRSPKRRRTAAWTQPEHIPDYLPPFPGASKEPEQQKDLDRGDAPRKPTPPRRKIPLPLRTVATSKSSYTQAVKYRQSSMTSRFEELADEVSSPAAGPSRPARTRGSLQPLITAYHAIQSIAQPAKNPARLRVANILSETAPTRYTAPDTIFSSSFPPPPRSPAPLPTHAVALQSDDASTTKASDTVLPKPNPKVLSDCITIVDDLSLPWFRSNLTPIARNVLPPHLHKKVSRANPPPPLRPSAPDSEELWYHDPIPAPWNSSSELEELKKKDLKKSLPREALMKKVSDAVLRATWDWTDKNPEEPLVYRRGKVAAYPSASHIGGVSAGGGLPQPASPSANGLRSPPLPNRPFAIPGLPASVTSKAPNGKLPSPRLPLGAGTPSIVLKTVGGRKASSSNGIEASVRRADAPSRPT